MRRAVRRPVADGTTASISSSVCRLPFISAWTLPARASSTALAAAAWLCSTGTIRNGEMSMPSACATARIFASGPTRIGSMRSSVAASTAPCSESRSQGCTTAQTIAGRSAQAANSGTKPSLWRSTICGVARFEYAIRRVGALTVTIPAASTSPCWLVQRHSNSMRWPSACLARAVTDAVSVSPTWIAPP